MSETKTVETNEAKAAGIPVSDSDLNTKEGIQLSENLQQTDTTADAAPKKKKSGIITAIAVAALALAGGITAAVFLLSRPQTINTGNARVTSNLVHISSLTPGRLERFNIYEGKVVQAGAVLGWAQFGEALISPVDGIVLHTLAVVGQFVLPGEPLAIIADTSNIHIQANLDETDIYDIRIGQPAAVTIDVFGNQTFTGYVRRIRRANEVELAGMPVRINTGGTFRRIMQTIPVEIVITDDVDLSFFLGASARVSLPVGAPVIRYVGEHPAAANINRIITEGLVESAERSTVFSNLGFIIARVYVEPGDRVSEGQILAALNADDAMLNVALAQAENAFLNARIDLETREATHESLSALYNVGGIARLEFRQSEDALAFARNNYNTARSQLETAELALGRLLIRAPVSGVVTAVNAREGAIGLGLLFVVEDTDNLRVRTRFREYDIIRLNNGMEVTINPIAMNGIAYTGTISRIHPAAVKNELGETSIMPVIEFEAEVAVTSPDTGLRIGMTTRLIIDLENGGEL